MPARLLPPFPAIQAQHERLLALLSAPPTAAADELPTAVDGTLASLADAIWDLATPAAQAKRHRPSGGGDGGGNRRRKRRHAWFDAELMGRRAQARALERRLGGAAPQVREAWRQYAALCEQK